MAAQKKKQTHDHPVIFQGLCGQRYAGMMEMMAAGAKPEEVARTFEVSTSYVISEYEKSKEA